MSARQDAARRLAALAAVAGAVACVAITNAEQGVQSIRLDPVPPSIVAGDTLRDSAGNVLRLRAVAFGTSNDSVADATFEYTFVPLSRDTTTGGEPALTVDPVSGLVRAAALPRAAQARVGARFGNRLQVLDTIAIVRQPRRLRRVGADTAPRLRYLCIDSSRSLAPDGPGGGTISAALAVRLTGDSGTRDTVPVPSYLVRYRITEPASIPTGTSPYGDQRPALYLTNGRTDRPLSYDTTNSSGQTSTALRVVGPLIASRDASPDTVRIEAVASYRGVPIGDTIRFRVALERVVSQSCP